LYRTLNKDASVVLLDEATSNCDVETEREFLKILKEFDDKMLLVITHNFSMLKDFDHIIAMDNGNVIADGTYDEISDIIYEMEGSN